MMQRNWLGSTIIVTCDSEGCGLCWIYDAHAATFRAARDAATRAGWECIRTPSTRRDTCRDCRDRRMEQATAPPAARLLPAPLSEKMTGQAATR
jgi:hypothetical protein